MSNTETVELLKAALAKGGDASALAKAVTATFVQSASATTGLQIYDLEAPAKNLYPVLTPLRNKIPRVSGAGGIQANWKGVTGIDTGTVFPGVAEGRRGGVIAVSTAEYFAAYRTIGMESAVTFEAELASNGFDDLRARATTSLLQGLMIAEEKLIVGGNTSYSIGTTGTPVLVPSVSGGTLGSITISVICVALTYDGANRATVVGGVVQAVTRTAADGQTDTYNGGAAVKSAAQTASVTGNAGSCSASITPMRGAFGYAWYWGVAGAEVLGAVTRVSQVNITANATGTQTAASLLSTDYSKNSMVFDGLLAMAAGTNAANNGSYYFAAANGAGLTGDGSAGVVEFDNALQSFWDNYRLAPSRMIVASQEMLYIRKKILINSNSPGANSRFVFPVGPNNSVTGGGIPKGYVNPFAMGNGPGEVSIELHPYMPPGTILMLTDELPYPMNNVNNIIQIRCRRDYYSIEWPLTNRQYQFGTYSDQVLQNYFMPSMGLLTNLSPT